MADQALKKPVATFGIVTATGELPIFASGDRVRIRIETQLKEKFMQQVIVANNR